MQDTPPRRSRKKPPKGSSPLPIVPIGIGIIVLGFVIGAGVSVVQRHGEGDSVALATSSPFEEPVAPVTSPLPTPIPAIRRRPVAFATVRAEPSASPSHSPQPRPSAVASSHGPQPQPQPTKVAVALQARPSAAATAVVQATPAPAAASDAATAEASPHHPSATPQAEETAAAAASPANVAPPAAATPSTVFNANGDFSRLAGNVVRQYLLALARGDTDSAYAALGDGPGSHPATVPEAGALDATMHIARINAVGSDSSATVNVDLTTANGPYAGQYTVHKSATGAAIIVSHTFGKP